MTRRNFIPIEMPKCFQVSTIRWETGIDPPEKIVKRWKWRLLRLKLDKRILLIKKINNYERILKILNLRMNQWAILHLFLLRWQRLLCQIAISIYYFFFFFVNWLLHLWLYNKQTMLSSNGTQNLGFRPLFPFCFVVFILLCIISEVGQNPILFLFINPAL